MTNIRSANAIPANTPLYFDDFITRDGWRIGGQMMPIQITSLPAVNLFETHELFYIQIVAPGLVEKDLKIEVTENSLDVQYLPASNKFEPFDSLRYWHTEYRPKAFRRRFEVNPDAIAILDYKLTSENGIFTFEIPKMEAIRGKVAPVFGFSWN